MKRSHLTHRVIKKFKLSNFPHFPNYEKRNIQYTGQCIIYTQKMQTTQEMNAPNLRQHREYYTLARSFSCANKCNKIGGFFKSIPARHCLFMHAQIQKFFQGGGGFRQLFEFARGAMFEAYFCNVIFKEIWILQVGRGGSGPPDPPSRFAHVTSGVQL